MITVMILSLPFLLLWLLGGGGFARRAIYRIGQGWGYFVIFCAGVRMTVEGRERIPTKEGVCLVSNHNSILDIVLILAAAGRPVGFLAKKELVWIPIMNVWILMLGGGYIDRGSPRKAMKTIEAGVKRLKKGSGILVFAEGTRSRGRGLLPFKPGSLKLATKAGVKIVPVAITGSYEVFEKTYRLHPGPVSVCFGEPIDPETLPQEDRRQNLAIRVRNEVSLMLERERPLKPPIDGLSL
jgi:1-acyl-sn-glycerol-3-phosphate acyltransferase